jgi:glycosyltransferase involved in cell wall biosynthesis
MARTSVVIPVKDGGRRLAEVLAAVMAQGPDELLVIDSGSSDGSVALARTAGAQVLEIEPQSFGHGRTRNFGVERTSGEIVLFLTQDATPVEGWLSAYLEALALDERVGAAFGPHRPRPGTSPMIARELESFFAGFSPDGLPAIQRSAGEDSWHPGFLSNANAAYRREALERIPFRDVPYAEDQAFARDLFDAGMWKAYHPDAAVLHAHDYPWREFMRRYFDEYRGLRETTGHVQGFGLRSSAREVRGEVARDREWMAAHGIGAGARAAWTARSAAHHGGRRVFSALGSRAERLPEPARRALSLEGRGGDGVAGPAGPRLRHVEPKRERETYAAALEVELHGPAPLLPAAHGQSARERLHVAVVIPPFRRGSGGHDTIFRIFAEVERMGHTVSVWLDDPEGRMRDVMPGTARGDIREWFAPARTSRWRPAGRPSIRCCGSTPAGRAPTSSRTTSPSSRAPARSRAGRSRATASACTRSARARGSPASCASATAAARRSSRSAPTPPSTTRCRASSAAATRSSSTAAPPRPAARCRSGCSRWPSLPAAARTCGSSASATPRRPRPRSRTSTPASPPSRTSRTSTRRRPPASACR